MKAILALVLASGLGWAAWWATPDQQGQRLMNRGEFGEAAETYHDPMRQGVAYFRAGEFEKADSAFARVGTAEAELTKLKDEVVQAIVGRLEPELDLVGYARTMHAAPENLSAWELYHRAMILVAERERESTLEAQKLFQRAVEIDPNFARAHSAIAQTYAHIAVTSFELMDFDDILRSARRAVACDNRDYWSYVALGIGLQFTGDGPGSLQAFDKAIELNPYNASTRAWFGEALISTGRASEAIEQLELAIRLSPEDPWIGPFYGRLSRARFFVGDYEGAVQAATKSFQYVHAWPVRAAHCAALARLGLNDEASAALTRLVEKHPKVTRGFVRARLPIIDDAYRSDLLRALAEAGLPE